MGSIIRYTRFNDCPFSVLYTLKMTTTVIHTDLDPSGNIAVGPNFPRKESSSANSSFEKGAHVPISDRGAHPLPTYTATFKGDNAFYTPIERYEGKHRYDPDFQWEPKEEKKLVRKVRNL